MNKQRKKEFTDHRTSWKWFERRFAVKHDVEDRLYTIESFQARLLMEILKELQFANDKNL